MTSRLARLGVVTAVTAATVALGVLPASAHIRVSSEDPSPGAVSVVNFRVPNEKQNASTVSVRVFMPQDTPLAFASAQTHPGWTAVVNKRTLPQPIQTDDGPISEVTSDIVWTAQNPAAGIAPSQFDSFSVQVGPLPRVASLSMPSTQTYSDGEVSTWNQVPAPGAPDPENPAPTLKLAAGGAGQGAATGAATAGASGSSGVALPLAIAALVVALLALVGLVVAVLRGRRT